ncbi:MAG TPA: histidinol-phosphate transaminase [Terriglobales bacterium]|nr:histidinol-phosphate transaminase [Terriglobales bacterium]
MAISRRNLLSRLAAGAMTGAAVQALGGLSFADGPLAPRVSSPSEPIFLCSNENAYGPSDKVLAVMREASSGCNRYPRAEYDSLQNKIAALHRVKPEQVVLGCGSSEILRLATTAFLGPGKRLVQASPTFPLPGDSARSVGAEVVSVPLNRMYEHDLDAMLARTDASTGLVYICNPNNPTGTLTARKDIETFIGKLPPKTIVLIDEAYHHFAGESSTYASFVDHPVDDGRVMAVRTFSKIYGLAGMRVGYAVAPLEIALRLSKDRLQLGISVLSAKAASAALDDFPYMLTTVKRNANDRQEFMNQVNARMLRALDSHTNFVMMNPLRSTDEVFAHLKKNNILVAPPIPAMNKYICVSLGTPAEMLAFWRIWDLMPAQKMAM